MSRLRKTVANGPRTRRVGPVSAVTATASPSVTAVLDVGLPEPLSESLPEAGLCNGTALRKASRRVSQLYDSVLVPCGLRSTQRSMLIHIARAGTPSMGQLSDMLVLDRSALTHNLKPLERDGLVSIMVDQRDKRSRLVALTPAGKLRLQQSNVLWRQAQQRFEAAFGVARATELRRTLAGIASPDFEQAFAGSGASQRAAAAGNSAS